MIVGILILLVFAICGILAGSNFVIPYSYSSYIAVAILACLDSVFGALVASLEKKFRMNTFLSGFFGNAIIAMFLVYLGEKLNVELYLAAVIVFGGRLLNNFSSIRRDTIDNIDKKGKDKKQEINKKKSVKTITDKKAEINNVKE